MSAIDARIILFLIAAFITGVLYVLRKDSISGVSDVVQIIINFLLVPAALATVGLFIGVITRSDPMPLIRQAAYQIGFRQLVSFSDAIPTNPNLRDNIAVADVDRVDTDGDGFREWIVFYEFDIQGGQSPIQAFVYDNDRGNPPVIFPYALRPPDRDYLSETQASIRLLQVTDSEQDEILIESPTELNIFEFQQNSEAWDFPRDAPPRYKPVGFFRGNGGVSIDNSTLDVTVIDRNGFERSQLAIRSIYSLNPATDSYLDSFDSTKLAAPSVSTIDFFRTPPDDIFETTFPEKIVLAFYIANCSNSNNETLCRRSTEDWQPKQFLAPGSNAMTEFENGNASYFGLSSFNSTPNLSVSHLRYYPQLETDPDLSVQGGGRDVVTGEQAQFNVVDITYTVATGGATVEETARFEMRLIEGKWKIVTRLPLDIPTLGSPIEVSQE